MITTSLREREKESAFVKAAAKHFAAFPNHWSYTEGDVEPGALLALRWGMDGDCVLVLRLDEMHTPVVYGNSIPPEVQ